MQSGRYIKMVILTKRRQVDLFIDKIDALHIIYYTDYFDPIDSN